MTDHGLVSAPRQSPAIAIMGPTASGKTALALELVERLPCAIISVDSALVYRGLDIGAAKPSPAILARRPHRLVDIRDPADSYSAASFRADALAAMAEITAAGQIPLLVGGTMLYFRALLRGLAPLPEANPAVRDELADRIERLGSASVHRWLAVVDPISAARIHPNDPQRIQRALEVYLVTGRTLADHWADQGANHGAESAAEPFPYRVVTLIQAPADDPGEREVLRARIAERFDGMLAAGFEAEVEQLRCRGDLHADLPAIRSVGYRQMWHYLEGACDFETMRERAIIATRQLAKRQLTWLRAEQGGVRLMAGKKPLDQALRALANAGIGDQP